MAQDLKEKKATGLPKWLIVVIVIVLFLFVGVSVSGFIAAKIAGKVVKSVVEQKTGAKFDLDDNGGSVKVKTEDGSLEMGNSATWPKDMPSNVVKFSYGTVVGTVKTSGGWSVIFKDVKVQDVEAYVAQLKSLGWEATLEMVSTVNISQLEKDNLQIALAYDSSSKGLNFTVTNKE